MSQLFLTILICCIVNNIEVSFLAVWHKHKNTLYVYHIAMFNGSTLI